MTWGASWWYFSIPGSGRSQKLYFSAKHNKFLCRAQGILDKSKYVSKHQRLVLRKNRIAAKLLRAYRLHPPHQKIVELEAQLDVLNRRIASEAKL
jgi:hypothetical protein